MNTAGGPVTDCAAVNEQLDRQESEKRAAELNLLAEHLARQKAKKRAADKQRVNPMAEQTSPSLPPAVQQWTAEVQLDQGGPWQHGAKTVQAPVQPWQPWPPSSPKSPSKPQHTMDSSDSDPDSDLRPRCYRCKQEGHKARVCPGAKQAARPSTAAAGKERVAGTSRAAGVSRAAIPLGPEELQGSGVEEKVIKELCSVREKLPDLKQSWLDIAQNIRKSSGTVRHHTAEIRPQPYYEY